MNQPAIFDTHCHYNLEPLTHEWPTYWQQAQAAGVIGAVVVGTDAQSSRRACHIAAADPRLRAAVGIHPTEAGLLEQPLTRTALRSLFDTLRQTGPIAALGETGLDYYRLAGDAASSAAQITNQKAALRAHLGLAAETGLPVIIHVRDKAEFAYQDVIEILREYQLKTPIILHCFSGPDWYLAAALALDCYISFAGNITYPSAAPLRQSLTRVPADRLLVETDAPFLPPQTHRGQTCAPAFINETVSYLTQKLALDPQQLLHNAQRIFTTIPSAL